MTAALCAAAMVFAAGASPAGAATNGLIAFQTTGTTQAIDTVDPVTGTEPAAVPTRALVRGLPKDSANPAWSPEGTLLAFSSTAGGSADIYVINADGTGLRQITHDPLAAIDPTWSPDGRRIAFTSIRDGDREIYVTDVAGGAEQRLTADPGADQQADWSPDGRQIAFESDRGGNFDIWLMATDGSGQHPLTGGPADESDAAWSPDSARLAFSSGAPGVTDRAIYSIDRAGGDRKQLTASSSRSGFPAWSPDGHQIAFARDNDLYLMPASGSLTGSSTFLASNATDPVWAPVPVPVSKPSGKVTVTTPSSPRAQPASRVQTLPTGTKVDTTDGSLLVAFRNPVVPVSTPVAIALVQGAAFTVVERTPETMSLRVNAPGCATAPATAAKSRRRSTRVRVKGGKGGHYKIINRYLIAASYLTAYTVTETCLGSRVTVTEGLVKVQPRTGKRRRVVSVRAGHSYFVAARIR